MFLCAGAPVAVPVTWKELEGFADARPFGIGDARALLKRATSASLKGWGFAAQTLPPL